MFSREGLLSRKDDAVRRDPKSVNVTPDLGAAARERKEFSAPEPAQPVKAEDGKGSKLIVGPNIKLRGAEITDCDTLVVEGRVEAAMDSRVIKIAEKGVFSGTVGIDTAEVHGQFEGELTARKQLIVHATGKVQGKIRYGTLKIEEGGEISGDIGALNAAPAAKAAPTAVDSAASAPDIMNAYDPFRKAKAAAK